MVYIHRGIHDEPQNHSMPAGAYHLLAVAVDILMAPAVDKYETILRLAS